MEMQTALSFCKSLNNFSHNQKGVFHMIEGTRMSLIFAKCVRHLMKEVHEAALTDDIDIADDIGMWTTGVVYTPYSIWKGIKYIKEVEGFETVMAKTGIKYVDAAARQFTFGVFFESNGHGDVCFDKLMTEELLHKAAHCNKPNFKAKLTNFLDFLEIVNDVN